MSNLNASYDVTHASKQTFTFLYISFDFTLVPCILAIKSNACLALTNDLEQARMGK